MPDHDALGERIGFKGHPSDNKRTVYHEFGNWHVAHHLRDGIDCFMNLELRIIDTPQPSEEHFMTSTRRAAALLLVSLVMRITWACFVPVVPLSDSLAYDNFAQTLADDGVYGWDADRPSAYWPVGTSAIYAFLYRMFGHSYVPIVVLHVLLGVFTVMSIYWLGTRWFGERAGWFGGLLFAIWPTQIEFTTILSSEPLYLAAMMAALLVAPLPVDTAVLRRAVLFGVFSAAAAYVRPTGLLFPLILLLWPKASIKSRIMATMAATLVLVVLIAPWCYRNTNLFGGFCLISTNGGANLWMGNNDSENLGYTALPEDLVAGLNERQRDNKLKDIALEHIKNQPLAFASRFTRRFFHLHDRESIGVTWNEDGITQRFGASSIMPLKLVNTGYWYVVVILFCMGIYLAIRQNGLLYVILLPPFALLAYHVVVQCVTVSGDRYHIAETPLIAIFAGLTLSTLKLAKRSLRLRSDG